MTDSTAIPKLTPGALFVVLALVAPATSTPWTIPGRALASPPASSQATKAGPAKPPSLVYIKKSTPQATTDASVAATLEAMSGESLKLSRAPWHYIGPFDNPGGRGFDTTYPPETEFDLSGTYPGKGGIPVAWKTAHWPDGSIHNLRIFGANADDDINTNAVIYLAREIVVETPTEISVGFGSDDGLAVWLNGTKILSEDGIHAVTVNQYRTTLKLKAGVNRLLVKVTQASGEWAFVMTLGLPGALQAELDRRLARDFPDNTDTEARYYRIVTLPIPEGVILEVGGMEFTPDGRLMVCTRRGEVWTVHNATAADPSQIRFELFASGLHEPLGLRVEDNRTIVVCQRPELTRLRDTNGDGRADSFETISDKWGVSGDYHEYAFVSPRLADGSYVVTLNVGFGGAHQAKSQYRGWALRVRPDGEVTPLATGLRSPNGLALSPDGDVFYTDNQGEWVASCKLHHIRPGDFYGHQAGLKWLDESPLAGQWPAKPPHGMLYDGQPGKSGVSGMPPHTPPVVWFPYGRMSQSNSEPIFDVTAGRFGPFAGQMINGDQTKSNLMRVTLDKVAGTYQGACYHLRSGFECGVNRLCWAPDGSLMVGMTNRGWGSVGPKSYGLQRVVWTGETPLEILAMTITPTGWNVRFTKPLDPATASNVGAYLLESYTYNYWPAYGSPEVDRQPATITAVTLSQDGHTVSLTVPQRRVGRVYELAVEGVRDRDGHRVLHPRAWYTLNHIPQPTP